jgi:hypothetical protein
MVGSAPGKCSKLPLERSRGVDKPDDTRGTPHTGSLCAVRAVVFLSRGCCFHDEYFEALFLHPPVKLDSGDETTDTVDCVLEMDKLQLEVMQSYHQSVQRG